MTDKIETILAIAFPEFVRKLRLRVPNAEVHGLSFFEIIPPPDQYRALDQILPTLADYDWLIFTSQYAVAAFFSRLADHHIPLPLLLKIAAIGNVTAAAIREHGGNITLLPAEATAAGLIAALKKEARPEERFLYLKAADSRPELPDWFRRESRRADAVTVYATRPLPIDVAAWKRTFAQTKFSAILISSPAQAELFIQTFGLEYLRKNRVFVLGETTVHYLKGCSISAKIVTESEWPAWGGSARS